MTIERNLAKVSEVLQEIGYKPYVVTVRKDEIEIQGDWEEGVERRLEEKGFKWVKSWETKDEFLGEKYVAVFKQYVRDSIVVVLVKRYPA